MSDNVGYHVAPKTKYYAEAKNVLGVGPETIEKSDRGFVEPIGRDWKFKEKNVKDNSETIQHDFSDFINRANSSDEELEENKEQKKNTPPEENIDAHEEKIQDEYIKKHEEETYVNDEYDKTLAIRAEPGRRRRLLRKIKQKIPHVNDIVEKIPHVNDIVEKIPLVNNIVENIPDVQKMVEEEKKYIKEKIKEKIPRYHIKIEVAKK